MGDVGEGAPRGETGIRAGRFRRGCSPVLLVFPDCPCQSCRCCGGLEIGGAVRLLSAPPPEGPTTDEESCHDASNHRPQQDGSPPPHARDHRQEILVSAGQFHGAALTEDDDLGRAFDNSYRRVQKQIARQKDRKQSTPRAGRATATARKRTAPAAD